LTAAAEGLCDEETAYGLPARLLTARKKRPTHRRHVRAPFDEPGVRPWVFADPIDPVAAPDAPPPLPALPDAELWAAASGFVAGLLEHHARAVAESRVDFMKNPQAAQEAIEAVSIQDFRAATKRAPPSTDAAQLSKLAQDGAEEHFGVPSLPDGSAEDATQSVERRPGADFGRENDERDERQRRPGDSGNHSTAQQIKAEVAAQVSARGQQLMADLLAARQHPEL
jgi:hypothetical protein